jgi:hypothetical protein
LYGLGSGIFFLSYTLLEVPSNLMLARFGARIWIARIMVTWGVLSSAMIFVDSPCGFTSCASCSAPRKPVSSPASSSTSRSGFRSANGRARSACS